MNEFAELGLILQQQAVFNWAETGSRCPADDLTARFHCQDIFCGETHNMLVAKIIFTQPTHKTDRWYWTISRKPRLRSVATLLSDKLFSNHYSCNICPWQMQYGVGFVRFRELKLLTLCYRETMAMENKPSNHKAMNVCLHAFKYLGNHLCRLLHSWHVCCWRPNGV